MSELEGHRGIFSWSMAEELAVAHMRSLGFSDTHRTSNGPDGGLDAIAADAVAQVKNYSIPVGAPEIQRLRGAGFGRKHALFYARSGYTAQAETFANSAGVALFCFTEQNQVVAINHSAKELEQRQSGVTEFLALLSRLRAVGTVSATVVRHIFANLDDVRSLGMTLADVERLQADFKATMHGISEWSDTVNDDAEQFDVEGCRAQLDTITELIAPVFHRLGLQLDDYSDDELQELVPEWGISYRDKVAVLQAKKLNLEACSELAETMKHGWGLVNTASGSYAGGESQQPAVSAAWSELHDRFQELAARTQTWIGQFVDEPTESAVHVGVGLRAEQEVLFAEFCLMFGVERERVGI